MDTVIGLVVLAALAYGAYRLVRYAIARVQKERGMTPEQKAHRERLREAEKQSKKANKHYAKAVRAAEKTLTEAENPKPIASHGGLKLYEDRIVLPAGTRPLTAAVTATVDTAGNFAQKHRSTVTRMGLGTVAAGPIGLLVGAAAKKSKDHDTRELYLLIDGGDWAEVVQANPDAGMQVRNFAQQVNVAARNLGAAKEQRRAAIETARRQLEETKGDRGAIDAAERHLAAVRGEEDLPGPHLLGEGTTGTGAAAPETQGDTSEPQPEGEIIDGQPVAEEVSNRPGGGGGPTGAG